MNFTFALSCAIPRVTGLMLFGKQRGFTALIDLVTLDNRRNLFKVTCSVSAYIV